MHPRKFNKWMWKNECNQVNVTKWIHPCELNQLNTTNGMHSTEYTHLHKSKIVYPNEFNYICECNQFKETKWHTYWNGMLLNHKLLKFDKLNLVNHHIQDSFLNIPFFLISYRIKHFLFIYDIIIIVYLAISKVKKRSFDQ